jgi:hypothetical protein
MRWKLVFTTNGAVVLFCDGEPVAASDDVGLILSFYGEVTRQTQRAAIS